jgi:hypothetical protein
VIRHSAQLKHLESKLEMIAQTLSTKHDQDASTLPSPLVIDAVVQSLGGRAQDAQNVVESADYTLPVQGYSRKNMSEIKASALDTPEDEVLLDRYQRLMAPNMPFVVLPLGTSASSLAKTEPFLMHAIRVVTYFHNTSQQQVLAKDLMRQICERLLMNGEKSLGLLQGLLIFLNWYNSHVYAPQNSTSLLHLAIALTTDLNIDRGTGICEKAQMEDAIRAYGVSQASKTLTHDERRAVLGTFYLTSVIFTSFRKVDAVHWTPWLADCANELSEAHDYQSDRQLVQLVHMQRIMQETMDVEYNHAPTHLYASSFLQDLKNFSTPSGNGTISTLIQLQDACTRIAIWQRSFANISSKAASPSCLRHQLDGMWHCMEAVKSYMDIYMDISVKDYLVVPFGVFAQFAYAFVVIVRALSLKIDGWDGQALRTYIDLSEIAEKASTRYEAVCQTSLDGLTLKNEAFSNWGVKLRLVKAIHDAKLLSAQSGPQSGLVPGQTGNDMHVSDGLVSGLEQQPPTSPMVVADPFLQSFSGFEDFWTGFYDPSRAVANLDLEFGNMS